jgi:hypothetical protein
VTTVQTSRLIKRTREYLVRLGNRTDYLLSIPKSDVVARDWAMKEVNRYFKLLMKTPPDVLSKAADELNERERTFGKSKVYP